MNKIDISVIIPTFNDFEYLNRAITSVLEQSYSVFEIIVVDDGSSTNAAKNIVEDISITTDINIIYHYQENFGASSARNKGVMLASSEFITFLDADDAYDCDNIKNKVALLNNKSKIKPYIAVYGTYWNSYNDSVQEIMKIDGVATRNQLSNIGKRKGINGSLPAYLLSKDIYQQLGGLDVNLQINEDFDFLLRLYKLNLPVIGGDHISYNRYYRPNSLTRNDKVFKNAFSQLKFLKKSFDMDLLNFREILYRLVYICIYVLRRVFR